MSSIRLQSAYLEPNTWEVDTRRFCGFEANLSYIAEIHTETPAQNKTLSVNRF